MTGTILHFDRMRLFGYLEGDDGKDYWFHASKLNMPGPWAARKVKQGDSVAFEIGINPNRGNEIAVNVTPIPVAPKNGGNSHERN
jgi:cold shock CspA family protein